MMDGLNEAVEIAAGKMPETDYRVHVPVNVNVKDIRKRQRLSQRPSPIATAFPMRAYAIGNRVAALVDKPSRLLLSIIDREPDVIERVLRQDRS